TSMRISPISGSTVDDGTTFASFTVYDQNNNDISSLVTLTAYPYGQTNGTPESEITCTYTSTDNPPDFECVAQSALGITATTNYTLLVSYAGYTGTPVTATLTVSP
ncbi:MAG: hypothetical protein ABSB86_17915, partial [Bryobacteraceae bacterium]